MMKKFGKTNVLAFLAVMSFGLLASCSQGNDNNPDKWAQDAIAMAEDSVEKVDNEMVGSCSTSTIAGSLPGKPSTTRSPTLTKRWKKK